MGIQKMVAKVNQDRADCTLSESKDLVKNAHKYKDDFFKRNSYCGLFGRNYHGDLRCFGA
jgi:hypothetical protein